MRYYLLIFLLTCFCFSCGETGTKNADPLNEKISEAEARNDLFYLRELIGSAHPSLHLYLNDTEWKRLNDSIYTSMTGSITRREEFVALSFLVNAIQSLHTGLRLSPGLIDSLNTKPFFFPEPLIWVEGKLLVNRNSAQLKSGTEIISVNGVPARQLLEQLAVHNTVDGAHRETQLYKAADDFGFDYYTHFGPVKRFSVRILKKNGDTLTIKLDPVTLAVLEEHNKDVYYFDIDDVQYSMSVNDSAGLALMRFNNFLGGSKTQEEAFDNFISNSFELLHYKKNIQTLVIDLRNNPGGDLYYAYEIFSFLTDKPFKEYTGAYTRLRRIIYPDLLVEDEMDADAKTSIVNLQEDYFLKRAKGGYQYADSLIGRWVPEKNRFTGAVYIITNAKVSSAASYLAHLVQQSGRGKLVGVETSGSNVMSDGIQEFIYRLPHSGFRLDLPLARIQYSYGAGEPERGCLPDYYKPDTRKSFDENKDAQINFIYDSLNLKRK